MAQNTMAGESNSERRPGDGNEQGSDFHSAPPQENSPSPFNDGPELIRDVN
jgi:hypothetical protein